MNLPSNFNELIDALRNYRIGYVSFPYSNEQGEVSKRVVNVGFSYAKLVERDLETLNKGVEFVPSEKYTITDWNLALNEKKVSMTSPSESRSKGQTEAYLVLLNDEGKPSCVKYNYEKEMLYVTGLTHSKVVLQEGVYKHVNSSAKTLAKKAIEKQLRISKYGMFRIDRFMGRVKVNKVEYETGVPALELEFLAD